MIDLEGRVALVAGSSRGIGRACALRLAEAGADVIVGFVSDKPAAMNVASQIRSLGRTAAVVRADATQRDDVESMLEFVKMEFGTLDILVSIAAGGGSRPLMTATDRDLDAAMHVNVRPLIHLVQGALPLLEQTEHRAKVIAVSSPEAALGLPAHAMIDGSMAALEAIVRHLAIELGDRGINFNVVRAGPVEDDSAREAPHAAERSARGSTAAARLVRGAEVADAVLFLASPLCDAMEGQTLIVDRGAANGV